MSFNRLDMVVAREAPVAVHDEGDMLRDWALAKGADEKLAQLSDAPGDGRRGRKPFAEAGAVERLGHGGSNVDSRRRRRHAASNIRAGR